LETLSTHFRQILIVSHVRHEIGHIGVERLDQLRMRDLLILDRVMQIPGGDQVGAGASISEQRSECAKWLQ
jgi:hypothetical protein